MFNEFSPKPRSFLDKMFVSPHALVRGIDLKGFEGVRTDFQRYAGVGVGDPENYISSFPFDQLSHLEISRRLKNKVIVDLGAGTTPHAYLKLLKFEPKGYIAVEPYYGSTLLENFGELEKKYKPTDIELEEWPLDAISLTDFKEDKPVQGNQYNAPVDFSNESSSRWAGKIDSACNQTIEGDDLVPFTIMQEDMLTALKRFPKDSVSLLASAIDEHIMGIYAPTSKDELGKRMAYLDAVNKECYRVLDPKGVFIADPPHINSSIIKAIDERGKHLPWRRPEVVNKTIYSEAVRFLYK